MQRLKWLVLAVVAVSAATNPAGMLTCSASLAIRTGTICASLVLLPSARNRSTVPQESMTIASVNGASASTTSGPEEPMARHPPEACAEEPELFARRGRHRRIIDICER